MRDTRLCSYILALNDLECFEIQATTDELARENIFVKNNEKFLSYLLTMLTASYVDQV